MLCIFIATCNGIRRNCINEYIDKLIVNEWRIISKEELLTY